MEASAAWLGEDGGLASIGTHARGEQSVAVLATLQHGCTGAVAEEYAGVAVLPVGDGGKFLGADHQHGIIRAGHDELLADLKRIDESGTGCLYVKRCRIECTDLFLHQTGGGGEGHVRRDGGKNDQIDIGRVHIGPIKGDLRRLGTQIGRVFIIRGDASLADASSGDDPFVVGIDEFFEGGIGQHLLWHVRADSRDGTGAADKVVFRAWVLDVRVGHTSAATGSVAVVAKLSLAFATASTISSLMW